MCFEAGGAAFAMKPSADAGGIASPTQQVIAEAGCFALATKPPASRMLPRW